MTTSWLLPQDGSGSILSPRTVAGNGTSQVNTFSTADQFSSGNSMASRFANNNMANVGPNQGTVPAGVLNPPTMGTSTVVVQQPQGGSPLPTPTEPVDPRPNPGEPTQPNPVEPTQPATPEEPINPPNNPNPAPPTEPTPVEPAPTPTEPINPPNNPNPLPPVEPTPVDPIPSQPEPTPTPPDSFNPPGNPDPGNTPEPFNPPGNPTPSPDARPFNPPGNPPLNPDITPSVAPSVQSSIPAPLPTPEVGPTASPVDVNQGLPEAVAAPAGVVSPEPAAVPVEPLPTDSGVVGETTQPPATNDVITPTE
jgi:hypothetical protein